MDHQQHQAKQPAATPPGDMDHSTMDHSTMDHSTMHHTATIAPTAALTPLTVMPASGQAREGGYDGRYVMEATDAAHSLQTRCAQASRGLVMLDNAGWEQCGARPTGAAQRQPASPPTATMEGHVGPGGHGL
jgi:uncharacterized protein involved in copper resistance